MGDIIGFVLAMSLVFWAGKLTAEAQSITPKQYEASASACYPNGGIKEVKVANSNNRTICVNKAEFVMEK